MNVIPLFMALSAVGVDYGWQSAADGQLEYIIQIEPELLASLAQGTEIVSDLPAEARRAQRIRIRVGRGTVPRQTTPAPGSLPATHVPADRSTPTPNARGNRPAANGILNLPPPPELLDAKGLRSVLVDPGRQTEGVRVADQRAGASAPAGHDLPTTVDERPSVTPPASKLGVEPSPGGLPSTILTDSNPENHGREGDSPVAPDASKTWTPPPLLDSRSRFDRGPSNERLPNSGLPNGGLPNSGLPNTRSGKSGLPTTVDPAAAGRSPSGTRTFPPLDGEWQLPERRSFNDATPASAVSPIVAPGRGSGHMPQPIRDPDSANSGGIPTTRIDRSGVTESGGGPVDAGNRVASPGVSQPTKPRPGGRGDLMSQLMTDGASRKPALDKKTAEQLAAMGESKPWVPLVFTSLALFLSLAGNVYLAWVMLGTYRRYRDMASQLHDARTATV